VPDVGVLAMVPEMWADCWQTRHYVLTRLARYFHVVWCNPASSKGEAQGGLEAPRVPHGPTPPGFMVHDPPRWIPDVHRPEALARVMMRERLRGARRKLVRRSCDTILLSLWRPPHAAALDLVPHRMSCYHIDDEYSFADVEQPTDEGEARLIRRVDQVFVTSLGLLDKKAVTPDDEVDCPKTKKVNGRSFKNSHDMVLGSVPFRTDFAKSCNTAFVNLAPKLGADGLRDASAKLGLGVKWDLGADAFTGTISPADSPTELAAATFGQGATAVSPLAMASATAAVARGQFVQPRLVTDPAPTSPAADGPKLAESSVQPLRALMRAVVTNGTGTALADVPGKPVSGKTGTAEFKDGEKETHAGFVGWQGDIAFAVMVQKGGAGAEAAVPIAQRFLTALNK